MKNYLLNLNFIFLQLNCDCTCTMATGSVGLSPEGKVILKRHSDLVEVRLTGEQEEYLERQFGKTKNPHPSEIILIAAEAGLTDEEVKVKSHHQFTHGISDC